MTRREILVSLDDDLVERIDDVAPTRGRSEWIAQACEAALANGAPTLPDGDGDAAVWQACAAAILEAWKQERGDGQSDPEPVPAIAQAHGGNGHNGNGGEP